MKCVICDKVMEPADSKHASKQPYAGGFAEFSFCFGSTKHDHCPGVTYYHGFICDECATPLVAKMTQKLYGMHGEPWSTEIQAEMNDKISESLKQTLTDTRPER